MKINQILDALKSVDDDLLLRCKIPSANIDSRIYLIGQVIEDTVGANLGEREPYLRENDVSVLKISLNGFNEVNFQNNDFLLQFEDEGSCEFRYYKLTDIEINTNELLLISNEDELSSLRHSFE